MIHRNLLIFITITAYLPTLPIKLTISNTKAREIFHQKKSLFGRNNAYNECYNILGRNPSFSTYNCRIIAQHLYQAQKHIELAREYHQNERQKALSEIEIIKKDIQTCLNAQSKMEADKKNNPELENNRDFAHIAAYIRNTKRNLEDEKRRLEKKENLYTQTYWESLSDQDKKDLRWTLEDGKLCKNIDEEMERIKKDLKK